MRKLVHETLEQWYHKFAPLFTNSLNIDKKKIKRDNGITMNRERY